MESIFKERFEMKKQKTEVSMSCDKCNLYNPNSKLKCKAPVDYCPQWSIEKPLTEKVNNNGRD